MIMLFHVYLLIFVHIDLCWSYFNLYLNETETKRLLGVSAELYYVRNGVVNNYALSFNLPIKSNIDIMYFAWQNLLKAPRTSMHYHMTVTSSDTRALRPTFASSISEGFVPTTSTVFSVNVPCTGRVKTEVDIRIQLNVTIFSPANLTILTLRRHKQCYQVHIPVQVKLKEAGGRDVMTTSTSVFYISVGCACGLILLVALLIGVCYTRAQKRTGDQLSRSGSGQRLTQGGQVYLRVDTPNNSVLSGAVSLPNGFSQPQVVNLDSKPGEIRNIIADVCVDRNRISLGEVLMEGTFGKVYHGSLIGEDENELSTRRDVYVKTVSEEARPDQCDTLLREACLLCGLSQHNLNPLVAVCLPAGPHGPPLLVFPHMDQGNLKHLLQRCKLSESLNTQQLVYIAVQLIRGLQHMHRRGIIHKDVATRNCIVDSNLCVKVTDNALARDLFPNDYHCLGDNENRPIKWLAMEALVDRLFLPASDVWAFGVTIWELMSLGQQPYSEVDPFEMATYLKKGYRVMQPPNCPDELFAVMACCWSLEPEERPKFSQLQICLQQFYTALGRFI